MILKVFLGSGRILSNGFTKRKKMFVGEGIPVGKGWGLLPQVSPSLPKTFIPVSGRWRSTTGGRRWPILRRAWEGGKSCSGMQKRPVIDRALYIHEGRGQAGRSFLPCCCIDPFHAEQPGKTACPGDRMTRGILASCKKSVQTRGARSVSDRAPLV